MLPAEPGENNTISALNLRNSFPNRAACAKYVEELPALLRAKGYVTVSVDSIAYDTTGGRVWLYAGKKYTWKQLTLNRQSDSALAVMRAGSRWSNTTANFDALYGLQLRLRDFYQERGYPFVKVLLDSLQFEGDSITALLKTEKGFLHRIDSIHVNGKARISTGFLQRHLNIANGSLFRKSTLDGVSRKLNELPYVQQSFPPDLTMLGASSVLNVYLQPRKSSQVNILLGILPAPNLPQAPDQRSKLLITGDAHLLLNNSFGLGETIGLTYQKLAAGAPRLNIVYRHPYLFRSAFGADFSFEMYKRDSSWLNIDLQAGARYQSGPNQTGRVFFQHQKTNTYPDTALVRNTKRLPDNLDVKIYNIGLGYELNTTDYRPNPSKGNELNATMAFGTKKILQNQGILELKDPANPQFKYASLYDTLKANTFQFKLKAAAARYFRAGKSAVLKTAFSGGLLFSQNYLRNEQFQLGGYRLLRGFDEESIFAARYAVATAEYRYRLPGPDSYFFVFTDLGYAENKSVNPIGAYTYMGTGLGLTFATKAGLFNISWAVGKRNDLPFGIRQSKIHFGYISLF